MDTLGARRGAPGSSRLRLAWVNPSPATAGETPRADLRVVAPAPVPPRPVKLDLAIERHLAGDDGLTRGEFLLAFAGRLGAAR